MSEYPQGWPPVLVSQFLVQHATANPDRLAVIAPTGSYTYAELVSAAKSYQSVLLAAGLRHGDAVVVRMDPGFEALAVLIACSETGLVYVPSTADAPMRRVAAVCDQTNARILITSPGSETLPALPLTGFASGRELKVVGEPPAPSGPDRDVLESDVAYVIFTSGSTGVPKGVVMSHRAALVAFRAIAHACDARERVASVAPLGFDFNLFDAAATLGRGRTLVYLPRSRYLHPRLLLEQLIVNRVEQLHCVPSLWSLLLRHCADRLGELTTLRRTVTGGEELPVSLVRRLRAALPDLDVLNAYGPTESICCAFYRVPNPVPAGWTAVPIGRHHPGCELMLVDGDGMPIDRPGVVGEVYLRSAALFNGYWRAPELTARALVPDPVAPWSEQRVLRIGDLAVTGPDGLTFVGRQDHQVQIYGNRVELEEVERCLGGAPGVIEAGVVHVRKGDEHLLMAGVVSDGELDSAALRSHCGAQLAKYMVPARFVPLAELPLTPAGKLDRSRLRELLSREPAAVG
ncbi:MAG: amino acid adenylation domain-containing protein [Kutzneria sp.]|nr:amino acid adenylation domain-containing protein [Kutzneria sp.]